MTIFCFNQGGAGKELGYKGRTRILTLTDLSPWKGIDRTILFPNLTEATRTFSFFAGFPSWQGENPQQG